MPSRPARNRLFSFPAFFTVFVILNALLVALALRWLWGALEQYETSTPLNAVKGFMARLEEDPIGLLSRESGFEPGEFSSQEEFRAYLEERVGQAGDWSYTPMDGGDENGLRYAIRSGDNTVAVARFTRQSGPRGGRMFDVWELTELSEVYEYLPPLTILAPPGAEVRVNGVLLTDAHAAREGQTLEGFKGLPENMAPPALTSYQIKDLLSEPRLEAVGPDGQDCVVEGSGEVRVVSVPATGEQRAQWEGPAREVSALYARFITKDAELGELNGYLLPGGGLARQLSSFYNGWYIEHDSYRVSDMEVFDFLTYGEDFFSCRVRFNYSIIKGSKTYDYPSSYTLYFVRQAGRWLAANLEVAAD